MAYLSWLDEPVEIRLDYEASGIGSKASHLFIRGPASRFTELSEAIEKLTETSEIRLDLPEGYIVFIKKRAGSASRLLIAHPEENEWVATLMLTESTIAAWKAHGAAGPFQFSGPGRKLDKMGNLEVTWEFGA